MANPDGPASVRIAAVLRERIRCGELAPGDRVPSTRAIVREWGVAMATATKVLAGLRAEGLVRALPGVGTVVEHPDGAPRRPVAPARRAARDPALSVDRVVDTAVAVADAEGLTAVTMRRIGAELGVATMSLYRYVGDKDDLLLRMMNAALAVRFDPPSPTQGWRATVEAACRALWARFRRHPWLAAALSLTRPQTLPDAMAYTEHILRGLAPLGLDPAGAFDTHLVLLNYVRGIAISLDTERQAEADTGQTADEWADAHDAELRAALAAREFPTLRRTIDRLAGTGYDPDLQTLFDTGLCYLLDGIERRLGRPGTGQAPPETPGRAATEPSGQRGARRSR